jgi:release factor glutamine methyltransferase
VVPLLARAGVPTPRVDAELLAAHVLGVRRAGLLLAPGFTPAQLAEYERLVGLRATRVPLQHLVGSAPFRHLELAVGPGVFIPRPETELLVDWALSVLRVPGAVVVDLCAGSGAIALSVATEAPGSTVYAVESSPAALLWLRRNVEASAVPVEIVAGSVDTPTLLSTLDGRVDVVVGNPPYVPSGVVVPAEVAEHDPAEAVFGGPDGLAVIRPVVGLAARLLRPGGWVGIEHDDSHGEAVPELLRASGSFDAIEDHRDLAGLPRFATARRMAD